MEISNEIKAKVFAQYLMQRVVVDGSKRHSGTGKNCNLKEVPGIFNSINRNYDIDQWCGVTYDLEDGLQFYDCFDQLCRTYESFHKTDDVRLILRPLSEIADEDAIEVDRIVSVSYRDIKGFHTATRGKLWVKEILDGLPVSNSYLAYQYLQSRGYDLPHYLLGGKTLHECGLAVYESEKVAR